MTRIHSVAGACRPAGRCRRPPFRAPHHGASAAAIVGGGRRLVPGEASLAHRGVLLLDELPEFPRPVLESLRQPLEDGVVSVARVGGQRVVPGSLPARRDDEPLPVRRHGRPGRRLRLQRRSASPPTARRCRGRCSTASTWSSRCPAPARRSSRRRPGSRRRSVRATGGRGARTAHGTATSCERTHRRVRAARHAPSSGCRCRAAAGPGRTGRPDGRGARRRRRVLPEHVAEALSYRAPPASFRVMSVQAPCRRRRVALPALLASDPRPAGGLWVRGAADLSLLAEPAVAIVGARACSSYGRSVARSLGARARRGRARRRQRACAGHRRRGPSRRARRARATVAVLGCGIDRDYPARTASCAGIGERGLIVSGVRAGCRAGAVALPGSQPHHRRALRGDGRGRGARALRRADHGRFRPRGRPRGDGGPGGDHVARCPRDERACCGSGRPLSRRWPTCSRCSGSCRRSWPYHEPEGLAAIVLARLHESPASIDELSRLTGIDAGRGRSSADRARARRAGCPRLTASTAVRSARDAVLARRGGSRSPARRARRPGPTWSSSAAGSPAARAR